LAGNYIYTRSEKPQIEFGRICPYTLGGKTVFITQQESFQLDLLMYVFVVFSVLGVIFNHFVKPIIPYKQSRLDN